MTNLEITPEQLARFKKICRTHSHDLDDSTARQQALNLLDLIATTRRPIPKGNRKNKPVNPSSLPTSSTNKS